MNKFVHAVVGVMQRGESYLISQRPPDKPYSGYWEFPGGKIEVGETPLVALKRELAEEIAIDVISAQFAFTHTHDYPDKTVQLEVWRVLEFRGEPQPQEGQVIRFATLEEIRALGMLVGNGVILEKL